MAILHGSWLIHSQSDAETQVCQEARTTPSDRSTASQGCLFLWGEVWRRIEPEMLHGDLPDDLDGSVQRHPFAMTALELLAFLRSRQESGKLRLPEAVLMQLAESPMTAAKTKRSRSSQGTAIVEASSTAAIPGLWLSRSLAVPSYLSDSELELPVGAIVPQHSALTESDRDPFLHPWLIEGICLAPMAAVAFLNSLPLGTVDADDAFVGGDLRFWSHVARWSLDLLARSKFLPGLERAEGDGSEQNASRSARWQPLLDSAVDQVRLKHFVDRMPVAGPAAPNTSPTASPSLSA
jgi:hypothetical protein